MDVRFNKLKKEIALYIERNFEDLESCNGICDKYQPCECALDVSISNNSLEGALEQLDNTFQEQMFYLIDKKKLDEVEVYNKAHIDRRLFSKIRSNSQFKPSKKTAICICLGMQLNLDETKDLLSKAGYTLSHSSKADLIIEYFIRNEDYDLDILNQVLYEYNEPLLYV